MPQEKTTSEIALRRLTESERETYQRDGVLHIQGAFDADWLDLLARGIKRDMENPSLRYEERTIGKSQAR